MGSRILQNKNNLITQEYGNGHIGIDIVGTGHTIDSIIAHSDGTVVFCQTGQVNNKKAKGNASYGNCVKIKHANGYYTLYAHMNSVSVKYGNNVKKGQKIGVMGNTGCSYGAHLHFEVWKDNTRINPKPYINEDLPGVTIKNNVIYQVYANGRWYSNITNYNTINSNGYAGVLGKDISAFRGNTTSGELQYRVHIKNGSWLDLVKNRNKDRNGDNYAGIYGQGIDAIMIRSTVGTAKYRVHTEGKWLPWVTGFSQNSQNGYAGNLGHVIDGIQIEIV